MTETHHPPERDAKQPSRSFVTTPAPPADPEPARQLRNVLLVLDGLWIALRAFATAILAGIGVGIVGLIIGLIVGGVTANHSDPWSGLWVAFCAIVGGGIGFAAGALAYLLWHLWRWMRPTFAR